jgi:hypothetical protein
MIYIYREWQVRPHLHHLHHLDHLDHLEILLKKEEEEEEEVKEEVVLRILKISLKVPLLTDFNLPQYGRKTPLLDNILIAL